MTDLPADDELELSLFGAGVGESVVIHIGAGSWLVVDSCINASTSRPIALEYLDEIGVDVANQVKLIVVTHWHDDHIQWRGRIATIRHKGGVCMLGSD